MKNRFILILSLSILLSGCLNIEEDETYLENENNVTQESENIAEAESTNYRINEIILSAKVPTTFNPLLNEDESIDNILKSVFVPFINLDDEYKPIPSIAENWYYTEDATVLNVTIKNDLYWHNGNRITVDDVIYSINQIKNSGENTVYKHCGDEILNATKIDGSSLEIQFKEANFANIYSLTFPIISKSYYENGGKDFEPLGNGPYTIENYVFSKEFNLLAMDNSFTTKPKVNTINVQIAKNDDIDMFSYTQRIITCIIEDDISGTYELLENSNKYSYVDNVYDFLGFNFGNELLYNKNIRKAIAHVVPIDNIIESIYLSDAVKANSPIMPTSWLYNEEITAYEYNLQKAREILDSEGFIYNNSTNLREKDGVNLTFTILINEENELRKQVATRIAEELNSLGFIVTIESVSYNEYISRVEKGDFQMFLGSWELSPAPDFSFMFQSGGYENYTNYSNPYLDQLFTEYKSLITDTLIEEKMDEIVTIVNDELPYVSLVFQKSALYADENIGGISNPSQFSPYNNIENWNIQ